jgi:hypothetical protein
MILWMLLPGGCVPIEIPGEATRQNPDYPYTPADVLVQCNRATLSYTAAEVDAIIATTAAFFEDGQSYDQLKTDYFDGCQAAWGFASDDARACTICFWAALDYLD